ncbi:MAG TPA: hypothetical protein VLA19_23530, partial [Herpetosiphonaceae bacterium]|nr:hypothetical protein [Herpetosiphonaceae bacterium]
MKHIGGVDQRIAARGECFTLSERNGRAGIGQVVHHPAVERDRGIGHVDDLNPLLLPAVRSDKDLVQTKRAQVGPKH